MTRSKVDTSGVDALADAVLTASRLLVAVSARSIAASGDTITLPQFRALVVLQSRGPMKLTTLAEHLGVNPSTATRGPSTACSRWRWWRASQTPPHAARSSSS